MSVLTQGTSFTISDDNITYENVGCVTTWTLDQPSRTEIDVTCTSDTKKQFRFGLPDSATVSIDYLYEQLADSAGQTLIQAGYTATISYWFKIAYDNGSTVTTKSFKAYIQDISENGALDDVVKASMNLKIDGDIVTTVV